MARKISVRTVANRRALDAIHAGFVDAFEAMGQAFVERVHPPDAEPFGVGLVTTPAFGVWSDGKKVAGAAQKPRGARIGKGITLIAGEGFPGRFQEIGTVHNPPQPHVTPIALAILPNGAQDFIKPHVRARSR